MSKASRHISIVRPDLDALPTSHVQARVIVGFCDDRGVPRNKDRFFIVEPRVGRQVQVGNSVQDRALLHPQAEAWNWQGDGKTRVLAGDRSIRIRLQHTDTEDAYSIGCLCFRAEGDPKAPKPPGKSPYCKSSDMVTASRWDGKAFTDIPCLGKSCPLRQTYYTGTGDKQYRKVDARTLFRMVGRIDEEGVPALLVSVVTGSDYNVAQFGGFLDSTAKQWDELCVAIGQEIPFPGYGLPVRLLIYESTGEGSRFPRIHYTLDCDIEELFQREIARRARMSNFRNQLAAVSTPLLLPASFDVDDDALDAEEVLNPTQGEATSAGSVAQAATVSTPAATMPKQTDASTNTVSVSTIPPTLFELVMKAPKMTSTTIKGFITNALTPEGTADADALDALMGRCIDATTQAPEKLPSMSMVWSPFADSIRELCPEMDAKLVTLGCPVKLPDPPAPEEDTPFGDVQEKVARTPDEALTDMEAALLGLTGEARIKAWGPLWTDIIREFKNDGLTQAHKNRMSALKADPK